MPAAAAARRNASAIGPNERKRDLRGGPGPDGPVRRHGCPAVVGIEQAHLARIDEPVPCDLGSGGTDAQLAARDDQVDPGPDERSRHAVAGRAMADGAHPVDPADGGRRGSRAQRGQRVQEAPFGQQTLGRHGRRLGVEGAVHLGAPADRGRVGRREVRERRARDQQVGLGIPHEVLDDTLGFGVGRLAEVGPEAVMEREGEVSGGRHDDVGDDDALETAHAVGEHDRGHTAQGLEALGEQGEGRGLGLVEGEPHEADPAPDQDRAEDVELTLHAPVDREVLARHRLPGPVHPALGAPGGLGDGDGAAQVAGRAHIPGDPRRGQEALGADPPVGRADALGEEGRQGVRVPGARQGRWSRSPGAPLHDPADGLGGGPAECRDACRAWDAGSTDSRAR